MDSCLHFTKRLRSDVSLSQMFPKKWRGSNTSKFILQGHHCWTPKLGKLTITEVLVQWPDSTVLTDYLLLQIQIKKGPGREGEREAKKEFISVWSYILGEWGNGTSCNLLRKHLPCMGRNLAPGLHSGRGKWRDNRYA
jgi:hypothetical protein